MSASTQVLDAFRSRHRLRAPKFSRSQEETAQLNASDGLRLLEAAPAYNVLYGVPPSSRTDKVNTYLWVIDSRGVPYILEAHILDIGPLPKHTNLTGGGEAYLGGEMWFTSTVALYISGGSGRYPPVNETQLEEAVRVFESFDYDVISLGWDHQRGAARRRLVGGE